VINFKGTTANAGDVINVLITQAKKNSLYGEWVN
jgi:hypothetical protein